MHTAHSQTHSTQLHTVKHTTHRLTRDTQHITAHRQTHNTQTAQTDGHTTHKQHGHTAHRQTHNTQTDTQPSTQTDTRIRMWQNIEYIEATLTGSINSASTYIGLASTFVFVRPHSDRVMCGGFLGGTRSSD